MGNLHKLIIEDDEGKTTVVPLSRGEITVGRMDGNTIRLMERNVSRRHARLLRDNGAVFIEDLNSFNGVKINGERIAKRLEIREGDLVEIGDYHLALQAMPVEDDATSRVDTTIEAPLAPAASPQVARPNGNGAHASGSSPQAPGRGDWRPLQGTVPDLPLSQEMMKEARRQYESVTQESPAASLRPAPLGPPEPLVSPPIPKSPSLLPPFPSGPLASPMFVDPGITAQRAREENSGARTEQIRVGPARIADVPRLVCVTTEYAGREFPLNRPEVVIGRLDDNDVVIEHRSVSKNHAKIRFDGRVHKIVDLDSANGILVNGEEYAITDLRRNDLIELGHVKFRFVLAGEAFVPTEDEVEAMRSVGIEPPPALPALALQDAPAAPSSLAGAAGLAAAGALLQPSATLRDSTGFRERPLEPPTVPLQTHLAQSVPAAFGPPAGGLQPTQGFGASPLQALAARELGPRDLSSARTEQVLAHDTVEMPVNMDLSNAATVTDTPISALAEAPRPRVDSLELPTDRPVGHEPRARLPEARLPEARTADPVRRGGSAAAPTTRAVLDDDDDLRTVRPSEARSTSRIALAAVVVLALLAGLGFALVKMSGAGTSQGLDQELAALVQRGELGRAEDFYLANVESFSDKKRAAELFAEAKAKLVLRTQVTPTPTVPAAVPPPTPEPSATAVAAAPVATQPAGESPVPEPTLVPADEPIPDGEEPAQAATPRAARRPDRAAADKPKRPAAAAADPKKGLDEAKRLYTDGFQAFMYGDPSRAKMHALSCLKSAEYPPCHSLLGRIYAQEDKVRESVKHYRQYLELAPNAPDASKVREIVANAEKSQ